MINAGGRMISEKVVTGTSTEINISTIAKGLYYLRYYNGVYLDKKSFIKQ